MRYEVQENCLTIFLPNELDHHNAEEIRRKADRLIEKHHIKCVIFDFGETNFMDSSGIGIILGRYKKIACFGGKVFAINADSRIKRTLMICGLHKVIEILE